MEVMIGVDPHKASHHVFAVDDGEVELAQLSVRASREQVRRLLAWAEPFERRTWAVDRWHSTTASDGTVHRSAARPNSRTRWHRRATPLERAG